MQGSSEIKPDALGRLWVAKYGLGLLQTTLNNAFKKQIFPSSVPLSNKVFLLKDKQNRIYCGFNSTRYFMRFDSAQNQTFPFFNPLIENTTYDLDMSMFKNELWVSSSAKIATYDLSKKSWSIKLNAHNPSPVFTSITHLNAEHKLLCSLKGLYHLRKKKNRWVLQPIAAAPANIYNAFLDQDSTLFLGCNNAEIWVSPQSGKYTRFHKIHIGARLYSFLVPHRSTDTIWLGTDKGLLFFNRHTLQYTNVRAKASFQVVYAIQEDQNQHLWLSTNNGIWMYHLRKKEFLHFSQVDGLPLNQFCEGTSLTAPDGRIWMTTSKGLCVFHPDSVLNQLLSPRVFLAQFWVNSQPYQSDTTVAEKHFFSLHYWDRFVTLQFQVMGTLHAESCWIRYRLGGTKGKWQKIQNGEKLRYDRLSPGIHQLDIQGVSENGVAGKIEHITLLVSTPYWQQPWFIALVVTALLALGFIASSLYQRARLQRAELQGKIAETEKVALLSQINPHFMSNALNTAAYLAHRGKLLETEQYLSEFADLMRKVLIGSRSRKVRLEDEVEMLKLYLDINRYQLAYPLEYTFNIGEGLDDYTTFIPTMLLQPLLENAIKHGLFHQSIPGNIQVDFYGKADFLCCIIKDNGVGRAAARAYSSTFPDHVSHGLQITQERLSLMGKGGGKLIIEDLYTSTGQACGTRVEIWIPVIECQEED